MISVNFSFPIANEENDSRVNPDHRDSPVSYRFDLRNIVFPKADLLFWFSFVEMNIQSVGFPWRVEPEPCQV